MGVVGVTGTDGKTTTTHLTAHVLNAAGLRAGYLATRHRGTVGGSLAHAAPWAELTAAAVALDARLRCRSTRGERVVAAREFFHGPHRTALEADELLTEVVVPPMAARTGVGFHEATTGHGGYLHAAAAATVTVADDGSCEDAELVLLGVAPTPHRLPVAERLRGSLVDAEAVREVDELLAAVDPPDGVEVSGTYRRRVGGALARRALADAAAAAREAA